MVPFSKLRRGSHCSGSCWAAPLQWSLQHGEYFPDMFPPALREQIHGSTWADSWETSMRTPLGGEVPHGAGDDSRSQNSHVLAESAPGMMILEENRNFKAVVLGFGSSPVCGGSVPLPRTSLEPGPGRCLLQHQDAASCPCCSLGELGYVAVQPLRCTYHPVKPHMCFSIVLCSVLGQR